MPVVEVTYDQFGNMVERPATLYLERSVSPEQAREQISRACEINRYKTKRNG